MNKFGPSKLGFMHEFGLDFTLYGLKANAVSWRCVKILCSFDDSYNNWERHSRGWRAIVSENFSMMRSWTKYTHITHLWKQKKRTKYRYIMDDGRVVMPFYRFPFNSNNILRTLITFFLFQLYFYFKYMHCVAKK